MKGKQGLILGAIAAANLVLLLGLGYGLLSVRDTLADRIAQVESANQDAADERPRDLRQAVVIPGVTAHVEELAFLRPA